MDAGGYPGGTAAPCQGILIPLQVKTNLLLGQDTIAQDIHYGFMPYETARWCDESGLDPTAVDRFVPKVLRHWHLNRLIIG